MPTISDALAHVKSAYRAI